VLQDAKLNVAWWIEVALLTCSKLRPKCGGLDHVHAAREGSDWLTALLGPSGFGLESRRISVRSITYIENLPIPLHLTNQPTTSLLVGWLVATLVGVEEKKQDR
jgi:hypothetical protein